VATFSPIPSSAPSGRSLPPPIYHISTVGELQDGDFTHDCWHARVTHETIPSHSIPMIVKVVRSPITLAIEIACGMAAKELRLNVPAPGLVVADREDLPGLSDEIQGKRILLVGSHYHRPDAIFAEVIANSPAAEEMVWQAICATVAAKQGAAWDELIANPDRHCENLLFDGSQWWLFDHDQALAPAAHYAERESDVAARQAAVDFNAHVNLLAAELQRRFANQQHAILEQIRRIDSGARRLHGLATYSRSWTHADKEICAALELIGLVLGLVHLRVPALAEKLQARLGVQPTSPRKLI
jgi:hypothetical protein